MTIVGFQEGLSSIRARIATTLIASAVAMYHWHESLVGCAVSMLVVLNESFRRR
jgi:hypothetical protein